MSKKNDLFVINPDYSTAILRTQLQTLRKELKKAQKLAIKRCDADVCCTEMHALEEMGETLDDLDKHVKRECNDVPFDPNKE